MRWNSSHKRQRGQASIFMALFITTMVLLFAFTTNIGMLVHAKINLQNAADAAAYAGAAVQARQLTSVAYLNWEMRRALKEFLFYYMVRSQYDSMPCFPLNSTGARYPGCNPHPAEGRHGFEFEDPRETGNNETGGPFLPTTCIIFDSNNNYCQKSKVPGIPQMTGGGWGVADPIVQAVINATDQIIDKKLEDCNARKDVNRKFMVAWLFNPLPFQDPAFVVQFSAGADKADPFPYPNGLDRLGILPRMALLRARVDNFEEALNLNLANEGAGSSTIQESTLNFFKSVPNQKKYYYERPIQAFLSAKNNLPSVDKSNGIFFDVELTELLPNQTNIGNPSPDLLNPPILVKFNEMTTKVSVANSTFFEPPGEAIKGACKQQREIRTIAGFPYGITKDPNVLTYYAVRLQSKVRLLFSPFGESGVVTLSAYSAAKPFGSRIGKDLNPQNPEQYMTTPGSDGVNFTGSGAFAPHYPNILVADGDNDPLSGGFARSSHLGYIRGAMVSNNRLYFGPRLAGAYAPWEIGFYTVPANFSAPIPDIGLFDDNPRYPGGGKFQLEAPVVPVNQGEGGGLGFLSQRVGRYLQGDLVSQGTLSSEFGAFIAAIASGDAYGRLFDYLNTTNELNYHLIPDPLLNDEPALVSYAQAFGRRFTVAGMPNAQRFQLTSWNNQKTASDGPELKITPGSELGLDIGRSGYSVRFISFATLAKGGRMTNDSDVPTEWSNPFDRFDGGSAGSRIKDDFSKLKH